MTTKRKSLCKNCRKKLQKSDANYMRTYREHQRAIKQAKKTYEGLKEAGLAKDGVS